MNDRDNTIFILMLMGLLLLIGFSLSLGVDVVVATSN